MCCFIQYIVLYASFCAPYKAKVSINKEGKIKVLEYNKKQPLLITNKIDKCLKTFRVKPEWIASGRVKVGENIVFLRFLDEY